MKETGYRFLTWCAGSDPEILSRCPRSEHIRHAGFGALVLIPAVMALFSMTYAISTVVDEWYFYVPAGIVWAMIVFFADRFLVSSFRKANHLRKPGGSLRHTSSMNLRYDLFSFSFISRLLLAAFIGMAVAHPMVLRYFETDIDQILQANKQLAEKNIRHEHDSLAASLSSALAEKEEYIQCLRKLLLYEQSNVKINTECGSTSGIAGFDRRAETIRRQLEQAQTELASLWKRDSVLKSEERVLMAAELNGFRETFSSGYIARENALVQLENREGSNARTVRIFLIVLLILIDTLAVSWKAMARRGPYDDYLAVAEDDVAVETQLHLHENDRRIQKEVRLLADG